MRQDTLEPVGHQLGDAARIHDRAGDAVRSDLFALLQDGDRQRLEKDADGLERIRQGHEEGRVVDVRLGQVAVEPVDPALAGFVGAGLAGSAAARVASRSRR